MYEDEPSGRNADLRTDHQTGLSLANITRFPKMSSACTVKVSPGHSNDDDQDMLCEEGENCCRLYSDLPENLVPGRHNLPNQSNSGDSEADLGMDLRVFNVVGEARDSSDDTRSEADGPFGTSTLMPRMDSPFTANSNLPSSGINFGGTKIIPACVSGRQDTEASCGPSGCTSSCSCCANLAWMRHRDALRMRRCRAKRGLPVGELDIPKFEQPSSPETQTKPCDQSCACCQILELRRTNARMRRKMYYQKRRGGAPVSDQSAESVSIEKDDTNMVPSEAQLSAESPPGLQLGSAASPAGAQNETDAPSSELTGATMPAVTRAPSGITFGDSSDKALEETFGEPST